jgi:hypothetical protein|tara:strand:+ start:92 stop:397 length:306 start_codon:yes stop_codon:yes gene_type:complete
MKRKYIIRGILLVVGILLLTNYQVIFISIVPPIPKIVSSSADRTSITLFDYSMKVVGEVINTGGDGFIVVKATAKSSRKNIKKNKTDLFTSVPNRTLQIYF